MNKVKRGKKVRAVSVGVGILAFLLAFGAGAVSKFAIQPGWAKEYSVKWSDELGTLKEDLPYGDGDANKFDLYLPKDSGKSHYGLAVYLHAGGFTSGDKSGDREMLAWLCAKGYVAAGINYTLRTDTNTASVLSQSEEIKAAIPEVIKAAAKEGYPIDKMTVAGISCLISRTGYTGEDGVELYCAAEDTVRLFEALLEAGKGVDMLPCGLGARRFEASMPLYGHEMSADINPVECGLGFAIKFNKPDFIGKEALLKPQTRKRIGLKIVGKGIARPDADVLCNGEKVGIVTSGGPAPAVGGNYAMALVSADADENGTWAVSVRGRVIDCEFAPMPFYKRK